MVCENEGADWLPFRPFIVIKSTEGKNGKAKSREAIWENSPRVVEALSLDFNNDNVLLYWAIAV